MYSCGAMKEYIKDVIQFLEENAQFDDDKHSWDNHISALSDMICLLTLLEHMSEKYLNT